MSDQRDHVSITLDGATQHLGEELAVPACAQYLRKYASYMLAQPAAPEQVAPPQQDTMDFARLATIAGGHLRYGKLSYDALVSLVATAETANQALSDHDVARALDVTVEIVTLVRGGASRGEIEALL
jgi:hypothetical protein